MALPVDRQRFCLGEFFHPHSVRRARSSHKSHRVSCSIFASCSCARADSGLNDGTPILTSTLNVGVKETQNVLELLVLSGRLEGHLAFFWLLSRKVERWSRWSYKSWTQPRSWHRKAAVWDVWCDTGARAENDVGRQRSKLRFRRRRKWHVAGCVRDRPPPLRSTSSCFVSCPLVLAAMSDSCIRIHLLTTTAHYGLQEHG